MLSSRTLTCSMSLGLLLLPAMVGAESSLKSGAGTTAVSASARLDFRIIIPTVLALTVVDAGDVAAAGATVRVTSNGRQVSMGAGVATTADRPANPLPAAERYSGRVSAAVLRAPRHGVIEQYADCSIGRPRTIRAAPRQGGSPVIELAPLLCTASTP